MKYDCCKGPVHSSGPLCRFPGEQVRVRLVGKGAGLRAHLCQDILHGAEQREPQAQQLVQESVVLRIDPQVAPCDPHSALQPVGQAAGCVQRPAQGLPEEGAEDTCRSTLPPGPVRVGPLKPLRNPRPSALLRNQSQNGMAESQEPIPI